MYRFKTLQLLEAVVADDFADYKNLDVDTPESLQDNALYNSITTVMPLLEYNKMQLKALYDYVRKNLSSNFTDDKVSAMMEEMLLNPVVSKRLRLHIAANNPELFDYISS